MSKPRGPFHPIHRPGSAFTDQQKKEISAFVSNALTAQADELTQMFSESMREFYGHLVANGCLVQEGVDRIAALQAERIAAEAAATGKPPDISPAPSEPVAGQPDAIAEPVDLASPIIQ